MKEITIVIYESCQEEGFGYDIYEGNLVDGNDIEVNSLDGGHCTTTIENAIDMACSQAKDLIKGECQCECHFIDTIGCKCNCNK